MHVLLSNDDGIWSVGLRALYASLVARGHRVDAVAPMSQQSGVGHAVTINDPLRVTEVREPDFVGTAVHGTPTDCVKLALAVLLGEMPDLVISGINRGPNLGPDIFYSGTVGAAMEAAQSKVPALAVSDSDVMHADIDAKARHVVELAEGLDWGCIGEGRVLNVNYPVCSLAEAKGVRLCQQTDAVWVSSYEERIDPHGNRYWWLGGDLCPDGRSPSDRQFVREGWVAITPLYFDYVDEGALRSMRGMAFASTRR